MNKLYLGLIIGFIGFSMFSCKTENSRTIAESKFYTDSIYSKYLSEYRKHNVYLPQGFNPENNYSIIFATDGSKSKKKETIKSILDSLIENKIIKPAIYIASHSNSKIADSTSVTTGDGSKVYLNYRNFEYVNREPNRTEDALLVDRFKNHMLYFKEELITNTEKQFGQVRDKKDRIFYGYSNGAGFGANLLNKYPDIIGSYICFSTYGGDFEKNTWKENIQYPDLYLQYGSDEVFILELEAETIKAKYDELNLFCEVKEFDGGHDYKLWTQELTKTLSKLLKTN